MQGQAAHAVSCQAQQVAAPPVYLQAHQAALGVADVQLRLTPLEEVFLTVARKVGPAVGKPAGRRTPACARWCA